MKITFNKDLVFVTEQLAYDLMRLGYDEEHIKTLVISLYDKADKENATKEEYDYKDLYNEVICS